MMKEGRRRSEPTGLRVGFGNEELPLIVVGSAGKRRDLELGRGLEVWPPARS